MSRRFNHIGLIGKSGDHRVSETLRILAAHLTTQGYQLSADATTAALVPDLALAELSMAACGERCDIAVIVGGDGTLLYAARHLASARIPLVGVNLGRLGFLVDISPEDMLGKLDAILCGNHTREARLLLQCTLERASGEAVTLDAFNDIVLHKQNVARMIEFETLIDGRFLNAQRSDGLIIATPTGSTAYALSGGGPILHPELDAILLVPICPHTLSNRPIVVNGSSHIDIRLRESEMHARLTNDGQTALEVMPGDRITICKQAHTVCLLHPPGHDHYDILRAKLGWGGHH